MEKLVFTENLVGSISSLQLQVSIDLPIEPKRDGSVVADISRGHFLVGEKKWIVDCGTLTLFAPISRLGVTGMIYQLDLSCDGQIATYYGEKRFQRKDSVISRLLNIWRMTTVVHGELRVDRALVLEDVHVIRPIAFLKQLLSFRFGVGALTKVGGFLVWFSIGLTEYLINLE